MVSCMAYTGTGTQVQLLYGQLRGEDRVQLLIGEVATGPLLWATDDVEGLLYWLGWVEQPDGSWQPRGFAYLPRMHREWQQVLQIWGEQLHWQICSSDGCYGRLPPGRQGERCALCCGEEAAA